MKIFSLLEFNVTGEFKFLVGKDWDDDYEAYGSFVIECEGNSDNVVWNRTKEQPQGGPTGQYWKKAFNYAVSTTESGKFIYHGGVHEYDKDYSDELVGSYENHTVNVKDIIGKEYVRVFHGSGGNHKVEISIKLTQKEMSK